MKALIILPLLFIGCTMQPKKPIYLPLEVARMVPKCPQETRLSREFLELSPKEDSGIQVAIYWTCSKPGSLEEIFQFREVLVTYD